MSDEPLPRVRDIAWFPRAATAIWYLSGLLALYLGLAIFIVGALSDLGDWVLLLLPALFFGVFTMQVISYRGVAEHARQGLDDSWLPVKAFLYLELGRAVPQALRNLRG